MVAEIDNDDEKALQVLLILNELYQKHDDDISVNAFLVMAQFAVQSCVGPGGDVERRFQAAGGRWFAA
jgi:hypothetical protein